MRILVLFSLVLLGAALPAQVQAGYIISSAILEFTQGGPRHQDIEIISQSDKNDYIVAEVAEILHPGEAGETRRVITDPSQSGLLVSPDKTVLAGGSRKVMRFIALREPDAHEHIYRVAIKPVIKNVGTTDKFGLKVLIGYEVLVIIRPQTIAPRYTATRNGNTLTIVNTGNTNILFQNGQQCAAPQSCKMLPVARVYPGQTAHVALASASPASYSVWDGKDTADRSF